LLKDGLTIEFYTWETIKKPLLRMYNECSTNEELSTSMKQGLNLDTKDLLSLDNWTPITKFRLQNYIFSFCQRLKTSLSEIINETQTGFMPKRHISCNIRLILDLIDYGHHINSDAIILFLDFCKTFDTIEHNFLFLTQELFGFGEKFTKVVNMLRIL